MDKEKAKEFILLSQNRKKIYISKNVDELIELNNGRLKDVYAVLNTEIGEKLFEMDFAYSGTPIIMGVFVHKDFFVKYYNNAKIIELY